MSIESSKEIERMFNQDSFSKKRIGSNIYNRVGTVKGGVKGGVKFSQYKYKKYEKNSKIKKANIYNKIIKYNKFKSFSRDMQKRMLHSWLTRYSKAKIKNKMGISSEVLNKLIDELDIKNANKKEVAIMRINEEKMREYKNGATIKPNVFELLPGDQKYELVDYYNQQRGYTNKDIADMLNYSYNTFNTKKSRWKKEFERKKGVKIDMVDEYDDDFLLDGVTEPTKEEKVNYLKSSVLNQEAELSNKGSKDSIVGELDSNLFNLTFEGVYGGKGLKDKFRAIDAFLYENKDYEVKLIIEEVHEGGRD